MAAEILPCLAPVRKRAVKPGRILVTWRSSTARIDGLLLPVLQALSPDRCTVLYQDPNVLQGCPLEADAVELDTGRPI